MDENSQDNKQIKTIQLNKLESPADKVQDKGHYVNLGRDSYIFCFEGWRGGGKTTAMTFFALKSLVKWLMKLISNFPIECFLQLEHEKKHIKSEELDFQKLLSFSDELDNSLIIIDEAPDIISHLASQSTKNRLINMFVRQLRKNRNSLFLGAQQYELIDKSLRWQVDIIVHCQDASRTLGNNSMQRGSCILLDFYDNSGMWTNHTWHEKAPYRMHGKNSVTSMVLHPSILWGQNGEKSVYDTNYQQDLFEALRKARLNLETYEITDNETSVDHNFIYPVAAYISELINSESPRIYSSEFYGNFSLTKKEKDILSKKLAKCDVRQAQAGNGKRYYDFSTFDMKKFVNAS